MAKETVNDSEMTPEDKTPVMEDFRWGMDAIYDRKHTVPMAAFAMFADTVRDITSGAATTLEIACRDETAANCADMEVLLSKVDISNLERLSLAALKLLNEKAAELQDWAYDHHTPEGKAERLKAKR